MMAVQDHVGYVAETDSSSNIMNNIVENNDKYMSMEAGNIESKTSLGNSYIKLGKKPQEQKKIIVIVRRKHARGKNSERKLKEDC